MAFELSYPLFFLLLLLQLPFSTTAKAHKNISLGSSLTALNKDSFWTSPTEEFAFGFQEIGKHSFLLAIWLTKYLKELLSGQPMAII
ncbi:hypothetical protein L3X38_030351 [Prunus dulcis]|uniref:Uncharacterized protein n=1 Tax=Prunus dulcis TaxID=3755 RepID=A0AAD4YTX2_PRUDU|nr:hypothetical protein L3X38_030351 [Prunus dulcis]